MHLVIARSMEIFKRLGLAEELRSLGNLLLLNPATATFALA